LGPPGAKRGRKGGARAGGGGRGAADGGRAGGPEGGVGGTESGTPGPPGRESQKLCFCFFPSFVFFLPADFFFSQTRGRGQTLGGRGRPPPPNQGGPRKKRRAFSSGPRCWRGSRPAGSGPGPGGGGPGGGPPVGFSPGGLRPKPPRKGLFRAGFPGKKANIRGGGGGEKTKKPRFPKPFPAGRLFKYPPRAPKNFGPEGGPPPGEGPAGV